MLTLSNVTTMISKTGERLAPGLSVLVGDMRGILQDSISDDDAILVESGSRDAVAGGGFLDMPEKAAAMVESGCRDALVMHEIDANMVGSGSRDAMAGGGLPSMHGADAIMVEYGSRDALAGSHFLSMPKTEIADLYRGACVTMDSAIAMDSASSMAVETEIVDVSSSQEPDSAIAMDSAITMDNASAMPVWSTDLGTYVLDGMHADMSRGEHGFWVATFPNGFVHETEHCNLLPVDHKNRMPPVKARAPKTVAKKVKVTCTKSKASQDDEPKSKASQDDEPLRGRSRVTHRQKPANLREAYITMHPGKLYVGGLKEKRCPNYLEIVKRVAAEIDEGKTTTKQAAKARFVELQ